MTSRHWRGAITSNLDREFLYLERHMPPEQAARIKALGIPACTCCAMIAAIIRRAKYPAMWSDSRLSIDKGQEGLDSASISCLNARTVDEAASFKIHLGPLCRECRKHSAPRPGHDLVTSIDLRIQYLGVPRAESRDAEYHAKAGSVIVIDVERAKCWRW